MKKAFPALCVIAGLAIVGLVGLLYKTRHDRDFRSRRANYEAIVARVSKELGSERAAFLISEDKDPASLRKLDLKNPADEAWLSRENEKRVIWATRVDDRITVTICTWSWGHAGVGGLYYSGGPSPAREADNAFGMGKARPLDGHWWYVEDYSQ